MGDAQKRREPTNQREPPMYISLASTAVSTIFFHPIETIKVRMQMGMGSTILQNLGHGGLYKGFSAGLLRELSYSAFEGYYSPKFFFRPISAFKSTGNALLDEIILWSGALALSSPSMSALVVNPVELAATRMQGDLALHPDLRRNHKNVLHAMYRAAADEGLLTLWRGSGPSAAAACAFTFGLITSTRYYGRIFDGNAKYSRETRIAALCCMGLVVPPLLSQPFDYVKTQMQMMQPDSVGKYPYTSSLDCVRKTLKLGGPLKFYSGFAASCLTRSPHTLLVSWLQNKAEGMKISFKKSSNEKF